MIYRRQPFQSVMVKGADRIPAMDVEPAVIPTQHIFYDQVGNLTFSLQ